MSALTVTPFDFHGFEVRTIADGQGGVRFVAADVARILGYSATSAMTRSLDEDEKGVQTLHTPGGDQQMTVVTEPGLYEAIWGSRVEGAQQFKKWVKGEVLPQIRKTGTYTVEPVKTLTPLEYAERLVDAERRALEGQQFKTAIEAGDGLTLRAFHKKYFSDLPEREFFEHLYAKGYLIDQRGKGNMRTAGPRAGTFRDGSQHRHPSYKGKPYLYLHGTLDHTDVRRESPRVRPGDPEIAFRDKLATEGLPLNAARELEVVS